MVADCGGEKQLTTGRGVKRDGQKGEGGGVILIGMYTNTKTKKKEN